MRERAVQPPAGGSGHGRRRVLSAPAAVGAAAVLLALVLTALRPSLPADLGTWAPVALSGEAVFALSPRDDRLLVGTGQGLAVLSADGDLRELGIDTRVDAVVQEPEQLLVATDQGLVGLRPDGSARVLALAGVAVHRLSGGRGELWAGAADGLHRRQADGSWTRSWPAAGQPAHPVPAVLAVDDGALFSHPEGLAFLDSRDGAVQVVAPDVRVVSLSAERTAAGQTRLWAGLFGPPLLLLSVDGGRRWQPRSSGLGFVAVNTVVSDPTVPDGVIAGGSGIADGTGNAGTQTSDDAGRTWQAEQGRLSNTHVFALQPTREPVVLTLRLAGLPASLEVALPVRTGRVYAGTNGGGVHSFRPRLPLLSSAAPALPALRLLEPLVAGLALLLCLAPAFFRLQRRGTPRGDDLTARPSTTSEHDDDQHEETA